MSDIAVLAAIVKTGLLEIAKQEWALGTGLQNAAPGSKTGSPNKSVQYLLASSEYLNELVKKCDEQFLGSSQTSSETCIY